MRTAEVKRRFLAHFESNGHIVVPSAPLPAIDDPNLLFINAGMVQFVPFFLGQQAPPFKRAVSVQKCIRTPDIDEVGKTSRHGTFFQMNGNFSFGDYFKELAIPLAWELSVKPVSEGGYGLDPERIWATVYLDDEESIDIWHRTGLPLERIVRRGKADNYWSMGIPGPAGPCSEIYYDRGPEYGKEGGPEVDEDRYLEFWNNVFMQYEITDVKIEGDRAYTESTAALRVARRLRGPWPALYALVVVPRVVRDWLYRFFASHRYAWFGKTEACRVPTPDIRRRFLDSP
jgi:alanyl-tRNA synthetase